MRIYLPRHHGPAQAEPANAARSCRPDLKVLFITGYAENTASADGQLEAGMHVMTRPFALGMLAAKIYAMIRGN